MTDRLILHIGATKTGTSAIQSALARNRELLLADGIFYPAVATEAKAQSGRATGGNGRIFRRLYDGYDESPRAALSRFARDLRTTARSTSAGAILFSHERSSGVEPGLLAEMKKIFSDNFGRVQVVFYVRHLADHALSQYGEFVRRRRRKGPFSDFATRYRAPFKRTIDTYEAVFEPRDVQYVLYDDVRQGLYRDFLQRIGVRECSRYEEPEQVNRSLTAAEIDIVRRMNALRLDRGMIANIVNEFTFRNSDPRPSYLPVTASCIEAIAANNADVIECVNARLNGGARLRVASEEVLERARDARAEEGPALDPEIMLRFLEAGLHVFNDRQVRPPRPPALQLFRKVRRFALGRK